MRIRARNTVIEATEKCAQWADCEVLSALRGQTRAKSGRNRTQCVVKQVKRTRRACFSTAAVVAQRLLGQITGLR